LNAFNVTVLSQLVRLASKIPLAIYFHEHLPGPYLALPQQQQGLFYRQIYPKHPNSTWRLLSLVKPLVIVSIVFVGLETGSLLLQFECGVHVYVEPCGLGVDETAVE